jgi:hypothetical protein
VLANRRRFSAYLPWLLLLLVVIVSFIVYFVGLNRYKAPPGCDYGNYLTQVEILRGNDLRGWGLRHNPVFFVILDVFLRFFEEFTALKIVASLVFAVIAIPFFLLARKFSGSSFVTVICTWLFVFFVSNSEMISWGGNPNFLAFSFMLLTLFFFVDLMNEPSKKNWLLSGFFLSLVVGTHILVAIYLLFSFFVFIIATTLANKGISKVRIKSLFLMILVAIVFSLPYLSFYLNFFRNSSNELAGFPLLSMQIPLTLDTILGLGEYWPFSVIAIVFVLGLFALSKYIRKEHKINVLLLCSLFLSPLILALFTANSIRWIYFLPIPLFLCFGIYLKDLFFDIKNSNKTIRLLAICALAIIGFQITVITSYHLRSATETYQFIGNNEIKALNWIKENTAPDAILATSGHPKGDIGGGGNSYSWWVEGYSKRVCMPSGNLQYYSYQRQRDEVNITNRIFDGVYSLEYGNIKVTESHPSSSTNPKIAALINGKYRDILMLNDAQHELFFFPNKKSGLTFENSTTRIDYDDTGANITITYEHSYFDFVRNVIISEDNSSVSVDVIFQIKPKSTKLNEFKINLFALFKTTMENCNITDNVVNLSKKEENMQVQITLYETNGKNNTRIFFEDPEGSVPIVNYSFEPLQDNLYVHIKITVDPSHKYTDYIQKLWFYNSYDIIKDLQIDYILLNTGRDIQYDRFLAESEHFTQVYQSSPKNTIIIFKVT